VEWLICCRFRKIKLEEEDTMSNTKNALSCILLTFFIISRSQNVIDVVIPCHPKDLTTLELAIEGIRRNGNGIRRIIVISCKNITPHAEWVDEAMFPFSKKDVALTIFKGDEQKASEYLQDPTNRIGWIYQQLLKLYAPLIIPEISPDVLILDADTIFLKSTNFIDNQGYALFNVGTEYNPAYFDHMHRLLPGLKKVYTEHSGISHHALFQKNILECLFNDIRNYHHLEPWQALCACIDCKELFAGISEYEIYFNFALLKGFKIKIRPLKFANIAFNSHAIQQHKRQKYDYVSCHSWIV
jgi:hypothetical protein